MKVAAIFTVILAASQCADLPAEDSAKKDEGTPSESVSVDAGAATVDAEHRVPVTDWMEVGPPPFEVPTVALAIPDLGSATVPRGTTARAVGSDVEIKLGEGRNFWFVVTQADADLEEARSRAGGETGGPPTVGEDFVIWDDQGAWFFRYAGEGFACLNPDGARHDRQDVELMLASCRTITTTNP